MRAIAAVCVLILLAPAAARADLACHATASAISFPPYQPFISAATRITGSVAVACTGTGTATYTISFNPGLHFASPNRRMANGSTYLIYQLYKDAAYAVIWGNGSGGSVVSDPGTCSPVCVPASLTIYAQIKAKQNVPPGDYSDTITLVVSY